MGEQLRYMGTSTVVRDIDFITTALEGPDALMYAAMSDYMRIDLTSIYQQLLRLFVRDDSGAVSGQHVRIPRAMTERAH